MKQDPTDLRLDTSLEHLAERLSLLRTSCVVATVVSATGSTYRKPGARMLVESDGRITGLLSGGCFENDLREHATRVLSADVARTVIYDMRTDNDLIFGIGAGCEGCMEVLLEPAHPDGDVVNAILTASALSHLGKSVALVSDFKGPSTTLGTHLWQAPLLPASRSPGDDLCAAAVASGQSRAASWQDEAGTREAWIQVVLPPPAVLICGAGPDVEPIVAGLRTLRFPVTVVDHRPAYAKEKNFPGATVSAGPCATLNERVELDRFFAAVIMSHHLESDAVYLRALAPTTVRYIGLLGPTMRRARLMHEVGAAAAQLEPRLHGPIGLDIGAATPEGIALAIVAEIHAAAAGRSGGSITTR